MATENIDIVIKEIGATETANSMKRIGTDAAAAAAPVGGLNSAIESLKGTLISLGLLLSGKQILDMADHYTVVIDKLKKYATSNEDLIQTEQKLNDIALATRQRMDEVASVYTGLARASQGAGVSQKELLEATTAISKSMTTMGASAGDVSEVMKRLAFSMQSGLQPGRAIAQLFIQFPALGTAISKELGISAKEFLNMARSGQLSMKQIVDAMASAGQAGKTLSNAFNATTTTLASAFTTLGGQIERYVGLNDKATGVSEALARGVLFLANNIDTVMIVVRAFTVALLAYGAATVLASVGTVSLTGALTGLLAILARPAVALAATAAALSLFLSYAKDIKLTADGSITALGALTAAFNILKNAAAALGNLGTSFGEASNSLKIFIASIGVGLLAAVTPATFALVGFFAVVASGIALILKASDALGFTKGAFASFVKSVADATTEVKKHALALTEVKAKTTDAAQSAADASQAWFKSSDAFKEVHGSATSAAGAVSSLGDAYLNGGSDADKFAEANERLAKAFGIELDPAKQLDAIIAKLGASYQKATKDANDLAAAHDKDRAAATGAAAALGMTQKEYDATHQKMQTLAEDLTHGAVLWNDWGSAAERAATSAAQAAAKANTAWKNANAGGAGSPDSVVSFGYGPQNQATADADAAVALSFAGGVGHQNYDPWYIATFGNTTTQDAIDRWKATHGLAHGGAWQVGGSGSTDSQLVQFMASPNEEISVRTPSQQRDNAGGGDYIVVNMSINGVQDTRDFNRNMGQIASKVRSQLSRRT